MSEPMAKWYCTELYPTNTDEDIGIAGDFAVYRAEDVERMVEGMWRRAVEIALQEEEPEGPPPLYIARRMTESTIVDNVLAAVRATKKGIAGALREEAQRLLEEMRWSK